MNVSSRRLTSGETTAVLTAAAQASLRAPSVFNTQPWTWHIAGETLELSVDRSRHLSTVDADGRLLLISCGIALHHARTALAATGFAVTVERFPDPDQPDLLARIRLGTEIPADPEAQRMAAAIHRRRTDRRAFGDRVVSEEMLTRLRRFVEFEGAYLHVVPADQIPMLAVSTERAAHAEHEDPAYQAELDRWTSRPIWRSDGVPPASMVQPDARRVPVRDFTPEGATAGLTTGDGDDKGAAYVIVFGTDDQPLDLLRGGEAVSALLLLATAEGLATAPLSEAVEVTWPRHLLRGMLSDLGVPFLAVRLGYSVSRPLLPAVPRRDAAEVITIDSP
ncbi:Acg family FMN-binding oxidoreductase [Winogradskya humida]|uniref:Nitroreductase n=1 Tax=Winogradskya humida TaxID=113566 RepID=A0ABQ3ZWR9_9ACTN|nr:nitroreductase [Actinoplanes humidus]GIE22959.1 hypothetical protein Ahu01nite_060610 [Actinoplanes humidus]